MSELAASILFKHDKAVFNSITARRLIQDKSFESVIERLENNLPTKFDVCQFFAQSESFGFLSGLHISQIVDKAELVELGDSEIVTITDDQNAYLVASGMIDVTANDGSSALFTEATMFGNMFTKEGRRLLNAKADGNARLFEVNLNDVFDVLTNYKDLTRQFVNNVSNSLEDQFKETLKTIH